MNFVEVLRARRSCRKFMNIQIEEEKIIKVLEAASLAPSPLNRQPWDFVVIRSAEIKQKIFESCERAKTFLFEASGWKWLERYNIDFLTEAPLLVGVVGDPSRTGAEKFFEGRSEGYQYACAAAVQNILLAATDIGLGSLWFSLFERREIEQILGVDNQKELLAIVCLGYCDDTSPQTGRKDISEKVMYLD